MDTHVAAIFNVEHEERQHKMGELGIPLQY
jgi:hypothetical protein